MQLQYKTSVMQNTVNLNNLSTAFRYKGNSDLRFTYYVFRVLQHPVLVKFLGWIAKGVLKYNIPLKSLIKRTVFKVFCPGENISEAFATIRMLESHRVKSVLDYVAEGEKTFTVFARNKEIIMNNILRLGYEAPGNSISVKFTSLEDPEFFIKMSKFTDTNAFGKLRYTSFIRRVDAICAAAFENKVVVYFDAEDRNMQDAFDSIVEQMMEKYNIKEAIIYNTLQMYLTDRLSYLSKLLKDSQLKNYYPGIKLVRGAYVEKERESARLEGRPSPVFETKEETDAAFDKALELCLAEHRRVFTCIASHNEKSTLLALEHIKKNNIIDHFQKVKFSQLYGMRDNLTFNLAANGFNASKYLPYGEVKKAIPYLIRRAEENSSIAVQLTGDLIRLQNELTRRKISGKKTNF